MTYLLFLVSVISRVVVHPANLTAVGASSILLTKKMGVKKSLFFTFCALIISDIFLGFGFYTPFVYMGFASYILFQNIFKKYKLANFYTAICGSTFFFLITNFGVWLGPWYEHTASGLLQCFLLALPFYRNMIIGDLGFLAIFCLAEYLLTRRAKWHTNLQPTSSNQRF
jgi:hypothetical protein